MRPATTVLCALALAAGCGGTSSSPAGEDGTEVTEERVGVEALSLAGRGGPVPGYVLAAPREGPRAGVVYLHGQGGDRDQLVEQASWLAARGAVAVTITAPSSAEPPSQEVGVEALERERDLAREDVAAVSAAVDYLAGRPDVDPERIGFVGWSAGARLGALVSGSERRIRAFVLMSGGADPVSTWVEQAPAGVKEDVRRLLGEVDPLTAIADARAAFLIQNGQQDEVVPRRALEHVVAAAPDGADVRWYDAGHGLNAQAFREQLAWLEDELGIEGPAVAGAATGP